MDQEFDRAYGQLNAAQQQAVEAIDGPVLVIAGPGTGKTQLLSLRVANILRRTDSDPASILGLTFTNFAATNMRQRLSQLVGPASSNVTVRTFHSFAAEIMNLYPDYFWNGARLSVAPDAAQLEVIESILSQLPLDNPLALKFAGAFTALGDVAQALGLAKEAGLGPEKLSAMLAVNAAYLDLIEPALVDILSAPLSIKRLSGVQRAIRALPDQPIDASVVPLMSLSSVLKDTFERAVEADLAAGKTTSSGQWKRRWLQSVDSQRGLFDERRRGQWWQALAGVYADYRDRLHALGYYDYSDMIMEVTTQLEQNPELLASVQERYLYVLIDEFQDTNAAQLRLAHLVASHHLSGEHPNLMAVGDDDQTIFAFNGAELNNMRAFQRTYPATKLIVLSANYRSSQAVLDNASSIIEQAQERLVKNQASLNKRLVAKARVGKIKGIIEHRRYPTRDHQLSAVAKRIQDQWQRGSGTIAVLARHHDGLRQLSALLNRLGVPINYEQQNNVLNNPLIQQIYWLSAAAGAITEGNQPALNHYLALVLSHPAWQLEPQRLWQLALANSSRPDWLGSLLEDSDAKLIDLGNWLLWLGQQAASEPLPVMLDYLIGLRTGEHLTSPLRQYFLSLRPVDNSYLEGLSALRVLRSAVNEFSASRAETTRLNDFVRLVQLHQQLDRPITDQSWFVSGERAVQLMSVHKAKGLEFDTVFILDAVEDNWRPRRLGRRPPANLPLQPYGERYDDYVRLLYVAVTRAKQSLIVSSYQEDEQGRATLATPLISQLSLRPPEPAAALEVLEASQRWPRLATANEQLLLQSRLQDYSLSVTALLNFLDVTRGGPQYFLEHHLLKLPELTTATMAYGTAIHRALQTAQQLTNTDSFKTASVLQSYSDALARQPLAGSEMERYAVHGQKVLKALLRDKSFKLNHTGQAEVSINQLQLGPATINGKLDRLDLEAGQLLITDYKTGKPLSSLSPRGQASALKAWRQRNQLLFYSLLAVRAQRFKPFKQLRAQIIYVEAASAKQRTLELQPDTADLERLEQLIIKVWQHIMDLNFPDCGRYPATAAGIAAFEDDLLSGKI